MARPRKQIGPEQVRYLAEIGCSEAEIASVVGCSDRLLRLSFADPLELGWAQRNYNLRKLQWESAKAGNATTLIFLGKVYLGQSNNPQPERAVDPLTKLLHEFRRRTSNSTES